jgi:hypothetical protein
MGRRIPARFAVLVLAAVSLAGLIGCGGPGGAGARSAGAASSAPGSGTAASTSAAPTVTLRRFGGFAGDRDEITVQPDGSWKRGSATGALSAADTETLRRMAGDPALGAEATRTVPESDCADAFDYSLTVGRTKVAWRDCDSATSSPETASRIARFILERAK